MQTAIVIRMVTIHAHLGEIKFNALRLVARTVHIKKEDAATDISSTTFFAKQKCKNTP